MRRGLFWWDWGDSNPHELSPTGSSDQRVYQFRHSPNLHFIVAPRFCLSVTVGANES